MNLPFVGRNAELGLLDRLWERPGATLLILYGRRRVGKTRLLTQWLQQAGANQGDASPSGRRVLYWVAEPSSALDQLRSFSQAVYNFANPAAPAPLDFTYATWSQAWEQVAALAQNERGAVYAIWGGIPAYWERINPDLSIAENIRHELLTANNLMQAEPRLLLQDFVSDPHNYIGILRAIANDARTQKEISAFTGLAQGHISQYLSVLQEAGFVERRVPVTQGERSRQGRYHIVDPYLRFYHRFLANRQTQLALGIQDQALEEIKRHLRDFIGVNTWEELCREWLLRASVHGAFPVLIDQVGSVWTRTAQVDVVGINSMEKSLALGECKWGVEPQGRSVLNTLVEKTAEIVPGQGRWQVHYLGFARAGWTAASQALAQELSVAPAGEQRWRVAGLHLLDLAQVDRDLSAWTE